MNEQELFYRIDKEDLKDNVFVYKKEMDGKILQFAYGVNEVTIPKQYTNLFFKSHNANLILNIETAGNTLTKAIGMQNADSLSESKIYQNHAESGVRIVSVDGEIIVDDNGMLSKISILDALKVKHSAELMVKNVDTYYIWMKELKKLCNGMIRQYPTAEEIMAIPPKQIPLYLQNKKHIATILELCEEKGLGFEPKVGLLKLALTAGLLESDAGVKNNAITLVRDYVLKNEKADLIDLPYFYYLDNKNEYVHNAKLNSLLNEIAKDKSTNQLEVGLMFSAITHFESLIEIKKSPTKEDLIKYISANKYKSTDENTKELARAASAYDVDENLFDLLKQTYLKSQQSKVKNLIDYAKSVSKQLENKECELSDKIMGELNSGYSFDWLQKDTVNNAMLGYICKCCAKPGGAGQKIFESSMLQHSIQNIVVKNKNGFIVAKSTAYLNVDLGQIVLHNIEVDTNFTKNNKGDHNLVLQAFDEGVKAMVGAYNKFVSGSDLSKISKVTIGMNNNDLAHEILQKYNIDSDPFLYPDFGGYQSNMLKQYVVYEEEKVL